MKMAAMQHSLQVARKSLWLPCAASNIPHACMIYSRCSSLPSGARSVTARIVFSDFCSCHPFAIFNADCFFLPVVFFLRIFEILVPCLIHILCMKDHLQFTKRTHHFNCGSINYAMDFFLQLGDFKNLCFNCCFTVSSTEGLRQHMQQLFHKRSARAR